MNFVHYQITFLFNSNVPFTTKAISPSGPASKSVNKEPRLGSFKCAFTTKWSNQSRTSRSDYTDTRACMNTDVHAPSQLSRSFSMVRLFCRRQLVPALVTVVLIAVWNCDINTLCCKTDHIFSQFPCYEQVSVSYLA